jgi:serine/threonine protein kinase
VIYCINPDCKQRQNPDRLECCQTCGTPLLIRDRYYLLAPLRLLDRQHSTEVFEIDDRGTTKVLKILTNNTPQFVEQFAAEITPLQWLQHPGIPKADIDGEFTLTVAVTGRSLHCLVMEKIEGQSLMQFLVKSGSISPEVALNWLKQLIEILDIVHHEGFFHRDIKPSNIILKPNGKLVLIDFGSVREITDTYLAKIRLGSQVTSVMSEGYAPSEQIEGKALPQSDFFALGRTFVHLLTGKHPLELPIDPKTGRLIWKNQVPYLQKINCKRPLWSLLGRTLADFIDELMAPKPAERPRDTASILKYLTRLKLFQRSIERTLSSPLLRNLAIGMTLGAILYRLSFPIQANFYYDRGLALEQKGAIERAKRNYETALKFNTKDSRIYLNLGLACQTLNDLGCAEITYQKVLELDENNSRARYKLAGLYDSLGNFDRAKIEYQLVRQSGKPISVRATSDLARVYILQGNAIEAIRLSKQGLQQAQDNDVRSALHTNLAWAYWTQANYPAAESHLQQTLRLDPDHTDARCLLAQVLEAKEQKTDALSQWQRCLDGDAQNRSEVLTWQTTARQRLSQHRHETY